LFKEIKIGGVVVIFKKEGNDSFFTIDCFVINLHFSNDFRSSAFRCFFSYDEVFLTKVKGNLLSLEVIQGGSFFLSNG
jgi:hypothetical protein